MSIPRIQSRGRRRRGFSRAKAVLGTGVAVIGLAGLFVLAMTAFRSEAPDVEAGFVEQPTEPPQDLTSIAAQEAFAATGYEARLEALPGRSGSGVARRGTRAEHPYLEVKTSLPEIDREKQYYEVWLLRKIPYGFFSAGEMYTNDLGEFVLSWEGERNQDLTGYDDVIITLERYEGSPDPGDKIIQGQFEK